MTVSPKDAVFVVILAATLFGTFSWTRRLGSEVPKAVADAHRFENENSALDPVQRPTRLVIFADYQCQYCAELEAAFDSLPEALRGQVTRYARHLPLESVHPQATDAAEVVECAGLQGVRALAHSWMYKNQARVASGQWSSMKFEIPSLDTTSLLVCLREGQTQEHVRQDIRDANTLGIRTTPSFLLNGRLFVGAVSASTLAAEISATLK